ncbi:hypothetical protein ACHAWO_009780 [Cyclotella atomus]|uniref:Uncharacterized protein n=1 Tax=Cyclotella atomus TaxID=382360 RepID=A0ABD3N685_9STRA
MTIFQSIQTQFADKDASATAINLARRMTRNNEPDLLQEDFMIDDDRDVKFSHDFCKNLALKVKHTSDYPLECHDYEDAMILLRRHNSEKKMDDVYAGMSPGDRVDAMRAKDEGHLSGAQIKRRMTTRNKGRWF